MERLTSKETREKITNRLMPYQFNADVTITQKQFFDMYDKLLAFEDFMDEVGAESLDEIETCIVDLNKENQTLKGNWGKLKEFVEGFKRYDDAEFNMACEILDEMQELESADGEL